MGVKDFTKGAESLDFVIPAGESITFKYRIIVTSVTQLSEQEINDLADEFATVEK